MGNSYSGYPAGKEMEKPFQANRIRWQPSARLAPLLLNGMDFL
jgi:hypothetical protein